MSASRASIRPAPLILIAVAALAVLFVAGRAWFGKPTPPPPPPTPSPTPAAPAAKPASPESASALPRPVPAADVAMTESANPVDATLAPPPAERPDPMAAIAGLPAPTPQSRDLVSQLTHLQLQAGGAMTAEDIARWKQNLQLLAQQGPAGVSAIREFLQKN